ncbi:MAG: hypothetical protein JNL65_04985 [Saprospiraceae bacterium]|nr:hypothetical protein [Saprospiraceae bacterium]
MKKNFLLLLSSIAFVTGGKSQLNQNFESASTLKNKEIQFTGFYSSLQLICDNSPEEIDKSLIKNTGIRFGFGISNKMELQLSYSHLKSVDLNHHFSIGSKISIYKNKVAASLPLSIYFGKEGFQFTASPKLILTHAINQYIDISLIPKAEVLLGGSFERFYSVSIGAGFSKNLQKWAIRPELGINHKLSSSSPVWSYGIGFGYIF